MHITIHQDGAVTSHPLPPGDIAKTAYENRPAQVSLHKGGVLRMHSAAGSCSVQLSVGDATRLAMLLLYQVRETPAVWAVEGEPLA
jgi:hypothetical protein